VQPGVAKEHAPNDGADHSDDGVYDTASEPHVSADEDRRDPTGDEPDEKKTNDLVRHLERVASLHRVPIYPHDDAGRQMTGELIASGRAADVYAHGDGFVLRRYRMDHDSLYEAAVMQHVRAHGYPVPEVVEVSGRDMIMERVSGPTMLSAMGTQPWKLRGFASTLARLVHALHEIPAPDWLHAKLAGGDALVHLDLHPDNVMLTDRGPVVIDWSNAGRGDPNAEVGDLWLIMSIADIPGAGPKRALLRTGRKLFVSAFMRHFDTDAVRRQLGVAMEHRLRDGNIRPAERERITRFVERLAL
jgi:aminoglycoside phosphotransferase (APT) family kinase protein